VEQLLSDKALETVDQLTRLLLGGAAPQRLAQLICLAAAERIVRFHTQNEFSDWVAVLHIFTYAHAVHERLNRSKDRSSLGRSITGRWPFTMTVFLMCRERRSRNPLAAAAMRRRSCSNLWFAGSRWRRQRAG
jgi:hypothetical protein